jgi:hypothetical protein
MSGRPGTGDCLVYRNVDHVISLALAKRECDTQIQIVRLVFAGSVYFNVHSVGVNEPGDEEQPRRMSKRLLILEPAYFNAIVGPVYDKNHVTLCGCSVVDYTVCREWVSMAMWEKTPSRMFVQM